MGRKLALTAALAAALTVAAAAPAQANWTHKGKGELKENASLTLSGELTLSTSAGNVSCPTTIGATLTASGSSGHVNSFTVSKPSECDLTGSLAAICGTHGLTKVEKTGSWALTADESDITLSGIAIDYTLAGCLVPSFRLEGSATGSLDKASAIGKVTLSGTQTLYNSAGEESGTGELKGTLSASPAGTYGVATGKSIETVWTDGNSHLGEDGKLTLAGTFSFSGSGGSVSCPATVKLLLESSTVEEEEAEGEVESFTVAKASECDLGGGYKTTCGTNAVAKVEQTGTATLTATAEDIKVSGLVLDYEFEKCAITSLKVEGGPTISVSSPEAIEEAGFSAGSLEVFNAKGETIGTATAGGSASASPSGTFQLASDAAKTEHEETTAHEATTAEEEETETAETTLGLVLSGEWYTDGQTVGFSTETGSVVEFSGLLSFKIPSGIILGPCLTHATALLWNENFEPENASATGEITGLTYTGPCDVTIPGSGTLPTAFCSISPTVSASTENPWHVNVGPETEVSIEGFNFTAHFSAGCQSLGFPAEAGTEGTATGQAVNEEVVEGVDRVCIVFNESGDFAGGITVSGEICAP